MIPLIAALAGFGFGWLRAARRGGGTADKLQYGFGHGLAFGLVALVVAAILFQAGLFRPEMEG